MRELEFLPDWYPQMLRRKRCVAMEAWLLVLVACGLAAWTILARRNVLAAETSLDSLQMQLQQVHSEQKVLETQLTLRKELQAREQLVASIGFPVQITRLLHTLDTVMPKEMSLIEFNCDIEEQLRAVTNVSGIKAGSEKEKPQMDRRLKVRLIGVAPSDVDLANFLAGLTNVPFFDSVAVTYARSRVESEHVMREFEVTFSMSLNRQLPAN